MWVYFFENRKVLRVNRTVAIGQIATFFWLIAWILLIARTSVLIAECFFDDMWAKLKMVSGHPAGPEGAEAEVRREAPNGGRSGAPRARRCAQTWFSILPSYHEKKFSYQQGSPSYQQNPRYQPKKRRYLYNSDVFLEKNHGRLGYQ